MLNKVSIFGNVCLWFLPREVVDLQIGLGDIYSYSPVLKNLATAECHHILLPTGIESSLLGLLLVAVPPLFWTNRNRTGLHYDRLQQELLSAYFEGVDHGTLTDIPPLFCNNAYIIRFYRYPI